MCHLRDVDAIDRQPSLADTESQRTRMLAQRHAKPSAIISSSHRTLLLIFATSLSPPKSAFFLTQFPFAESDVAPIPPRTPSAYHRNHPPHKELPHGPVQHLASSHSPPFEAFGVTPMDLGTCAAKDCGKPRFLDYYVCAEHFAFHAAPQYTDSMLVKVDKLEPAPFSDFSLHPEAVPCVATQRQSPPPDPTGRDATKRARIY